MYKFRKKEIQPQTPGDPREHRLGKVLQRRSKSNFNIMFFFFNFPLVFTFKRHLDKFQNRPKGKLRDYHLGEVLQKRLELKFIFTLSYSIVLFVFVQISITIKK